MYSLIIERGDKIVHLRVQNIHHLNFYKKKNHKILIYNDIQNII